MKSFNEFVYSKESMDNPNWETALKISQNINKILRNIPPTVKEVVDIRPYAADLELAIYSYSKAGKSEKDPLKLVQRIGGYLQQIPRTVKEVMDIRLHVAKLEQMILSLMN